MDNTKLEENSHLMIAFWYTAQVVTITLITPFLFLLIAVFFREILNLYTVYIIGSFVGLVLGVKYAAHSTMNRYTVDNPDEIIYLIPIAFPMIKAINMKQFIGTPAFPKIRLFSIIIRLTLLVGCLIYFIHSKTYLFFTLILLVLGYTIFYVLTKHYLRPSYISLEQSEQITANENLRIRKIAIIGFLMIILSMIFVAFQK